jgi:NTP pyrophosphatase (non-canonical NTP hydrolase)
VEIKDIQALHCAWLRKMGWVGTTTPLEQLALICSEVGEAVNECRGPEPTPNFRLELADIVLRALGLADYLGLDLEAALLDKIAINAAKGTRGRLK